MRKGTHFLTLVAVILAAGLAVEAWAQQGARNYNPQTGTTITGTITAVEQQTGRRGWNGTHLEIKTGSETVSVHLGPSWFLAKQGVAFAEGDQVEITGSKMEMGGMPVVLAREVKKDGKTVTLRDEQGLPLWSQGRGR